MAQTTFLLPLLLTVAHLLTANSITIVEVASCGHLLTYLRSCSENLSLVITRDIDCSLAPEISAPVVVSGQCVISGGIWGALHAPMLNWGSRQGLVRVSEDSTIMVENLHMRFGSPRGEVDASSIAPVFELEDRSRVMLTSVVVSFEVCGGMGEEMERRFGLDSKKVDPNFGTFYFGERSAIVQENGASALVCHLGVHCGREVVSRMLESFVEQVTSEDVSETCASSHVTIEPGEKTEMKGVWVTIGLGITIIVLLVLLALVRKEITDRMVRMKSPFRIASTRQILARAISQDSPSFQIQDVQKLYDDPKAAAKEFTLGFGDEVHVNPLFCAADDILPTNPLQGKAAGLLVEGTPVGFPVKAAETSDRLERESTIHVPACGMKIHEGLRSALWCQNVMLYLDTCELGSGISSALVKGSYSGELVAVGIHEHDAASSEEFCQRALQLSRLIHPNVLRIFFALEEDHALEDVNQENQLPSNTEERSWGSLEDAGLIVQSALVMELCDLGTLARASPELLSFFHGWWNMPNITLVLLTAVDIAEAMAYLHEHGHVHGNLKLESVQMKSNSQDPRGFVCKVDNLNGGVDNVTSGEGRAKDVREFGQLMLSLLSMGEDPSHAFGVPQALLALLWSCCDETVPNQLGFNVICKDIKGMLAKLSTRRQ